MAGNNKVRDLLLKDVEEENPIYTCFSSYEFEPGNEQACNAVAVMYEDRVVGHIPLAISKCFSLFLTFPGSYVDPKATGKRINRGGYGLKKGMG